MANYTGKMKAKLIGENTLVFYSQTTCCSHCRQFLQQVINSQDKPLDKIKISSQYPRRYMKKVIKVNIHSSISHKKMLLRSYLNILENIMRRQLRKAKWVDSQIPVKLPESSSKDQAAMKKTSDLLNFFVLALVLIIYLKYNQNYTFFSLN